jgi:signal transduction histidine kinase
MMSLTSRIAARSDRASNLVVGSVISSVLAADTAVTAVHHHDWVFELAVGVVVCALALLRGTGPVRAAAAGLVVCFAAAVIGDVAHLPSQPGVAATLSLLVLGAAAIRAATHRAAALITLSGVVVMVVGRVTLHPEYVAPASLGVMLWIGALGLGVWLRLLDARRNLVIDTVRREERLELARELHDVVAHHITGIVVQAQAARIIADRHPESLSATLTDIESAGNDALSAMRKVVGLLRDPRDAGGFAPTPERLADLVGRFAERGPSVQLRLPEADQKPSWPPEIATTVYRIVQEALTNVALHAPAATNVTVVVDDDHCEITVHVTDDAPAGSPTPSRLPDGGHGLVGMRERVQALGGTLRAGPKADAGWAVTATLPLPGRSSG